MERLVMVLLWLVPLSLAGLAIWLPGLLPDGVLAFIGHAALSLIGVGGIAFVMLAGLASAMRS